MRLLKQSTAEVVVIGPFLDQTDGFTAETGLTIAQADVQLSKNAAAFAQKNDATSCSHLSNGYYSCSLDTTDSNALQHLHLIVNATGALPVWHEFMVVPANAYDSVVLGSDNLEVNVLEIDSSTTAAQVQQLVLDNAMDVVTVVADGGNNATQVKTDLAEATDDHYINRRLVGLTGANTGAQTRITDYIGSSKIAIFNQLTDAPADGDTFILV